MYRLAKFVIKALDTRQFLYWGEHEQLNIASYSLIVIRIYLHPRRAASETRKVSAKDRQLEGTYHSSTMALEVQVGLRV